jgi:hypothetical protein
MIALKKIPTLIGGAAVLAAATLGLTAAIASAERLWDIEVYDNCMQNSTRPMLECCLISGGEIDQGTGECGAPPAKVETTPEPWPPQIANQPTVATNAPVGPAPGSRAPGRLPTGGVAAP